MTYINWKKTILITLNVTLATYLVLAMTAFNKPDRSGYVCKKVNITIADKDSCGFLSAEEVKRLLTNKHLFPKGKAMSLVDTRAIEEALQANSFINSVECFKTLQGTVGIRVTQRLPMLRVMANNGEDYYIDVEGKIMQGGHYSSDLIVATGNITQRYAQNYVAQLVQWIMDHDFWKNQVEQINILPDKSVEIVPRVGNHIVCLGRMPEINDKARRERNINRFVVNKLNRLHKFYLYGLNEVGWNKYDYVNLEFDNQIICRRNKSKEAMPSKEDQDSSDTPTTPKVQTEA